ncbi:MAG TPA: LamG-like jellyroll fold domain-containing protein [Sedimentisphaerales bacterium]|nr:LamG-like jellyroll fold domain-containing protein [Sedimentisphaerales bacterium]
MGEPSFRSRRLRAVIAKGDDAWRLATNGATQNLDFAWTGSTRNYMNVASTTALPFNEWHHICCVYSKTDGGRIYVNGRDEAFVADTLGITTGTYPVYIGDNSQATGRFWNGLLDDLQLYNRALSAPEILRIMKGLTSPGIATNPNPGEAMTDVPRDTVLSWTPGAFAATHDVYLGTSFDDVNDATRATAADVLAGRDQTTSEFEPDGLLEFGQTYYWRVDEVNAAPDNTIFKGEVWSFTAEPFAYPIRNVTATASSSSRADTIAQNTVNGSGLNAADQHSVELTQMWMSGNAKPHWIQYQFDQVYKLDELWVWNANQIVEAFVGFGAKDVTVEYSTDGAAWATLDGTHEFARASAAPTYAANTVVDFGGVEARFVKLTINSNWGGVAQQVSLSEVRFFYVPVQAREPQPANAATDVPLTASMNWRPGREATSHKVFFGTDGYTVAAGTAASSTVTDHVFTPPALTFGTRYFWKVDELGGDGPYAGPVWDFTTQQYAAIDDFEGYTDDEGSRIYESWIDGVTDGRSGSTVGYMQAPFAEKKIVHTGKQAMPLTYDNSTSPFVSEAELAFDSAQNWTANGADSLVVWFRGQAPSFAELTNGNILMNAIGADIWNYGDEFRYAYKTLTGNGTMVARIESLGNSDAWAKAGVMIRQSIEPGSTHAFMSVTVSGGNGASFQQRLTANGISTNNDNTGPAVSVPYWVKIERTGDAFSGFISPDGVTWTQLGTAQTITMTGPILIGLALTSHNTTVTTAAEFSNVSTTGNVTGSWQIAEIGVEQPAGNSMEGLYLSVKDSSGKAKVLQHPDPAATVRTAWQQWRIPLSEFTSAGVKMNAVKSIVIGVGDKTVSAPRGSGIIFIDDIGYGRSEDQ